MIAESKCILGVTQPCIGLMIVFVPSKVDTKKKKVGYFLLPHSMDDEVSSQGFIWNPS